VRDLEDYPAIGHGVGFDWTGFSYLLQAVVAHVQCLQGQK
jgi:hypothetical protein